MTTPARTPKQETALAAARKAAFGAFADHQRDMASNPAYKAEADRQLKRRESAAVSAGRSADFLRHPE